MFSECLHPIFRGPQLQDWVRGWVRVRAVFWIGVSRGFVLWVGPGVSLGVYQTVTTQVRLAPRFWGGGGCLGLGLANTLKVFIGGLGEGEAKVTGNLVELAVVSVFHPDNPRLPLADSAHSPPTRPVNRDLDVGAHEGVIGTISPL